MLVGAHPGLCVAVVEGDRAGVRLPGEAEVRRLSRSLLPGWLAAMVGLAPRPRAADLGLLVVDHDQLQALLAAPGGGEQPVADALGPGPLPAAWAVALAALPGRVVGRWRLVRQVLDPDGVVVPTAEFEMVDAGEAGVWQVSPVGADSFAGELIGEPGPDRPVALSATSATSVWELLTAV